MGLDIMAMLFEILLAIGVASVLLVVDHIFQFSNRAIDKSVRKKSITRSQARRLAIQEKEDR